MNTALDKPAYREKFDKAMMFNALSALAQEFLFDRAQILAFEAGEKIVEFGDLSPSFFVVMTGTVHVTRQTDGHAVYIDSLGEGTAFGEAAMFLKAPRTADVSAADACVVVKLTRFDLMDFLRDFPRDGNKVLLSLIYGLMLKLKSANTELVFERRSDATQGDVDALLAEMTPAS